MHAKQFCLLKIKKTNLSKMVILHQNKFAKPVLEAIYSKN